MAARQHGIPPVVMLAVADNEGGKPGLRSNHKNGTYDIGSMQISTRYLADLNKRHGITERDVAAAGCYAYTVAAARLRKHIDAAGKGGHWQAVANYHSRTPRRNRIYRRRLLKHAAKWEKWLKGHGIGTQPPWRQRDLHRGEGGVKKTPSGDSQPQSSPTFTPQPNPLLDLLEEQQSPASAVNMSSTQTLDLLEEDTTTYVTDTVISSSSQSVGSPHAGKLREGIQAHDHPGYHLRDPRRAWGTAETVRWIAAAFRSVVDHYGNPPHVMVHDLSRRSGGKMKGHKSHQSGRDADVMYYRRGCTKVCKIGVLKASQLNARIQWTLLSHWLHRDRAEFIFIDYKLQAPLHAAAKADGASEAELNKWFQYPHGASHGRGIIRHVPNHADHLHVRFTCPDDDAECKETRDRDPVTEHQHETSVPWLDLLEQETE